MGKPRFGRVSGSCSLRARQWRRTSLPGPPGGSFSEESICAASSATRSIEQRRAQLDARPPCSFCPLFAGAIRRAAIRDRAPAGCSGDRAAGDRRSRPSAAMRARSRRRCAAVSARGRAHIAGQPFHPQRDRFRAARMPRAREQPLPARRASRGHPAPAETAEPAERSERRSVCSHPLVAPVVAGEKLIRAFAGKEHLHMLARHLADRAARQRRRDRRPAHRDATRRARSCPTDRRR